MDAQNLPHEPLPNGPKFEEDELRVPGRRVELTNGETFRIYDTTGPQGCDAHDGLPARRAPWIATRVARGDRNFSQMHYARRGVVTEEMRFVALRENMDAEFVRSEVAAGGGPGVSASCASKA